MNKLKFISLLALVLCLLIIVPASFAADNLTDGSDGDILTDTDYYFDVNNTDEGNGSSQNPYNTFSISSISDNSNVYFAEGEYSFDKSVSYSNISFIGQNAQNTVLNGNGYTLTVSGQVTFKNITLTNLHIINNANFTALNTVFDALLPYSTDYNHTYGGAIYAASNKNIYLDNCTFKDNSAQYGGAIYAKGGNITIINSFFKNNIAYNYGGAISARSGSKLKIYNTNFISDSSTVDAGGAIYLVSSTLEVYNVTSTNCSATFGPVVASLNSYLTFINSTAQYNTASYEGGAIYQIYGTINVSSSKFINNTARNGGGLFIDEVSSCELSLNDFINNSAYSHAGAIYLLLCDDTDLSDSIFTNNTALYYCDIYQSSSVDLSIGNGNYTMYVVNVTSDDTLPSYYNLNDYGYLTAVKNQEDGGNCWAFAPIAALESCILKASGEVWDFSEENMKNIMALYSDYGWSISPNNGGNDNIAVGYLVSWLGPVNDSDDLYDGQTDLSPVLNSLVHVQNVLYLKRDSYTDNDGIKSALMKYGAVATSMCYSSVFYYNGKVCHYYTGSENRNHAVTIVGWDDTFEIRGKTGAWIVRNSWSPDWANNGYFYVSYYDTKFAMPGDYASYTFILNDTQHFDKNYQYDIAGKTDYFVSDCQTVWYKNIFNATDNEFLSAVSTYFQNEDIDWELNIYVNDILKANQSGISQMGYFTINLNYPIILEIGDIFEVQFKISGDYSDFGFPISEYISLNKLTYSPNISFVSYDGENWSDLYNLSGSYSGHTYYSQVACIKAFTQIMPLNTTIKSLNVDYDSFDLYNITVYVLDENNNVVVDGNVTFNINGEEYTLELNNSMATIQVSLIIGENNISASFYSPYYYSSNVTTCYDASLRDLDIDISVVQDFNNANLTFTLSQKVNETLLIYIDNENMTVKSVNGVFKINLTDLEYGNYTVNVTIVSYLYCGENTTSFFVNVKNTYIKVDNIATLYNSGDVLNITLFDEFGSPVSDVQLKIILDNNNYYKTTDSEGIINLETNLTVGTYDIEIFFEGDDYYISSNASAVIVVNRSKTTLNITGIVYDSFNLFNINVSVFDELNQSVNVGNLIFTVNNISYASGNLIPFTVGQNNISVFFDCDNYYSSSLNVTYVMSAVSLDVDIGIVQDFNNVNITFSLSQMVNETLLVYINNINKTVTSVNGVFKINLTDLEYGNYTVNVSVVSDLYTGENSTSFFVDVKKTYFAVDNITTFYNSGEVLNITLFDELGSPLNDAQIKIIFNNNTYYKNTDEEGSVCLEVNLTVGTYDVDVFFEGDDYYISSNVSAVITVNPSKTTLNITGIVYDSFNLFNISVSVFDELNQSVNVGNLTFVVNEVSYSSAYLIPFTVGQNNISVFFDCDNYYSSSLNSTYVMSAVSLDVDIAVVQDFNNANLTFTLSQKVNETLLVYINGDAETVVVINGAGNLNLIGLDYGNYTVNVSVVNDVYAGENSTSFFVDVKKTYFAVDNITTFYNSGEVLNIVLFDEFDSPLNNTQVKIVLDNNTYYKNTDEEGSVCLEVNLTASTYDVDVFFEGDDYYISSNVSAVITVNPSKTTLNITGIVYDSFNLFNISVSVFDELNQSVYVGNLTFVVNEVSYSSAYLIPFTVGQNNISVFFDCDNYYSSSLNSTYVMSAVSLDVNVNVLQDFNNANLTFTLSQNVNETLLVYINGDNKMAKTVNGVGYLNLTDLDYGNYTVNVSVVSDVYTGENSSNFFVNVLNTYLEVYDFTTVYNSGEFFTATLKDQFNRAVAGCEVLFTLNNQTYSNITDSEGKAIIAISLSDSVYSVSVGFEGDGVYISCQNSSTITVKSSLTIPTNTVYTLNANYEVYLLDKAGNPLNYTQITFSFNNANYYVISDGNGKASLTIPLTSGSAVVSVINPSTGEVKSQTITVVSRLSENTNIVMYYGAGKYYKVKVLDDEGNIAKGITVTFQVNGKYYYIRSDSSGYASLKITLKSGKYTITATYKGFKVSNKITVKPTLITKNKKVKKAKKIKYTAKLLNTKGKSLKGKKITFKIKGKKYKAKTNKKGIAKIKIKNLKVRKYKITARYGKLKSTSIITVKK